MTDRLSLREAELLSYYIGRAKRFHKGVLVFAPPRETEIDLKLSRTHLAHVRARLMRKGCIRVFGETHCYVDRHIDELEIENSTWLKAMSKRGGAWAVCG